jgi:hypothetical protein
MLVIHIHSLVKKESRNKKNFFIKKINATKKSGGGFLFIFSSAVSLEVELNWIIMLLNADENQIFDSIFLCSTTHFIHHSTLFI